MRLDGGCACGEIRFAVEIGPEAKTDFCHCRACRKASGAPVTAWLQVAPGAFHLRAGRPQSHVSSPRGRRFFCGTCGSPLYMTDPDDISVGVMAGALDDPGSLRPSGHGWCREALAWLKIDDGLPRHEGDPPWDDAGGLSAPSEGT
ncbi:Glutathione-dependent formaldehyde-activating enzyme [Methylobrevis pamukkalensis]|uniref:Glutathione-dependent formaldehyde-activating enzyme n=2 Tax=Methylobrevis pamukkalensis TaxID=1439726 RepID=A0A1E3H0P6_9HYPH|nr:Glutathione-dependent formaldehyde-activating enzyme [Methylobrevis pamukkalensis]